MSNKKIPTTVIMLGMVSLCTDAATEMIYPLIPVFVAALGSGAMALGVIEGVAETTAAMLKLISGVLSDKIGRHKWLVLIGYSISSLIRPLTGLVTSAWEIVVIRMLDRVGKGIRTAPRDALIAAAVEPNMRGKAYGFHRAMDHAGAVVGPLLAIAAFLLLYAALDLHDPVMILRWTFGLALIPGIMAVLTILFFVKESQPIESSGKSDSFVRRQFDRNFYTYLGTGLLFTLGNSSDAFLLFRVEEAIKQSGAAMALVDQNRLLAGIVSRFGDTESQAMLVNILFLPLIWAFFHTIKAVCATPLGTLSDRIGRKKVILTGWGIYALVYGAFAFLDKFSSPMQIMVSFLLFAVYALYYAFCEGAEKALVADLVSADRRGSAFGLYNFSVGLGALPASLLFGVLYSRFGPRIAFGWGAALALAAMILMAAAVREPEK